MTEVFNFKTITDLEKNNSLSFIMETLKGKQSPIIIIISIKLANFLKAQDLTETNVRSLNVILNH